MFKIHNTDILFLAYNKWNSAWRGDQHISLRLSEYTRVIYCDPDQWLFENIESFRNNLLLMNKIARSTRIMRNLFIVQPLFFIPFSRTIKTFMKLNYLLFIRVLKNKFLIKNPILWINKPINKILVDIILDKIKPCIICFRWADNWAEFPGPFHSRERVRDNCNYILSKADIVFTVSKYLYNLAIKIKTENVYLLPNGVDVKMMSKLFLNNSLSTKIDNISKPIFGYIGTINERIKFDWIIKVATFHPEWNFVFIGPEVKIFKIPSKVKTLKNIYFIGKIPYEKLPFYFKKIDVFLLPHKKMLSTVAMDPIKLYEYLFTGKPIVATDVIEPYFHNYIYIVRNYQEFEKALEQAIQENNPALSKARHEIALKNTWEDRVAKILKIIHKYTEQKHFG